MTSILCNSSDVTFLSPLCRTYSSFIPVLKGMSDQSIISIVSTNPGPFGANSVITFECHLASDGILQFSKNCIVFLEIRDLENLLFSTACLNLGIYLFQVLILLTDLLCGGVDMSVLIKSVSLPQTERIKGSSPGHTTFS